MTQIVLKAISTGTTSRIVKFLCVGGSIYILSVFLLFIFSERLNLGALHANLIQTLITYTIQFVLSAVITWRDRKAGLIENLKRVARYIPTKVLIWSMNQVIYSFWIFLGVHYQIANAFTVLLIMSVNYLVFDRFIFTSKEGI